MQLMSNLLKPLISQIITNLKWIFPFDLWK